MLPRRYAPRMPSPAWELSGTSSPQYRILGLVTSSRVNGKQSFPCHECRGLMARDVVGRVGYETQIWHGICCNSLKRRAQEGWRSVAVHRPHVSNFSSSKDPCTMLVIGPSLPVRRYLWPFSRSRQLLLRPLQFRLKKLATDPRSWSTRRYGAVHMAGHAHPRRLRRDWCRPDHYQKDYRTPWQNSLGRVGLWRRLNF
jgi:hypothetical protein